MSSYWDQVDAVAGALHAVHTASDAERAAAATALDEACREMVGPVPSPCVMGSSPAGSYRSQ